MSFKTSVERLRDEREHRLDIREKILGFGVDYLDDALRGIFPHDLLLVGASSGLGKTQFCVNIAVHNSAMGKRVHFFALEAEPNEIERRAKWSAIMSAFFKDPYRLTPPHALTFQNWIAGDLDGLSDYEEQAMETCEKNLVGLRTFYKESDFTVGTLVDKILSIESETDLIVVDHVHYFDWDGDDNHAIKEIMKTVRDVVLENGKPVILVAHLRKRDRGNKELVPGMEEFQGSSELFKIPTRVFTMSPGGPSDDGNYKTYLRVSKNRYEGSVNRYIAECLFNPKTGLYEKNYKIGWSNAEEFEEIEPTRVPDWARKARNSPIFNSNHQGARTTEAKRWAPPSKRLHWMAERD